MGVTRFLILFTVFVASAHADALRVDALTARIQTTGGPQGGVWNLWSNGELGEYILVESDDTYTITVWCHGSPGAGVWPLMGLSVDGALDQYFRIYSPILIPRQCHVYLTAGMHTISTVFLNDYAGVSGDRNLYIESIQISPNVELADIEAWRNGRRNEVLEKESIALADAEQSIERIRKEDVIIRVIDASGRPVPSASLSIKQTDHDFRFGCNIFAFDRLATPRENKLYKKRFKALFNYATAPFYWKTYEPQHGAPNYASTDAIVAWCKANGISIKGHPILWANESAQPLWALGYVTSAMERERVRTLVKRYKNDIDTWEVVNEPIHCEGIDLADPHARARDANENAQLVINESEIMAHGFQPFYDLLSDANAASVPYDVIGIQAHEPDLTRFPLDRVKANLDKYATLGKEIHITEFTPPSSGQPVLGYPVDGVWDEQTQANYAVKFYTVCFAHPAVTAISWWDFCDAAAWRDKGGLLRADMSPKPVYIALRDLIRTKWMTRIQATSDKNGEFRFRGFRGTYSLVVEKDNKKRKTEISITSTGETLKIVLK